jgi:hypothetical protein
VRFDVGLVSRAQASLDEIEDRDFVQAGHAKMLL